MGTCAPRWLGETLRAQFSAAIADGQRGDCRAEGWLRSHVMQADSVLLDPVRFAGLVAPAITRTFVAGMRAAGDDGSQLVRLHGGPAVGYVIDLRNPLAAGRGIRMSQLRAVYRYTAPSDVEATVQQSVAGGLLSREGDGSTRATERGRRFLGELYALHDRVLTDRWPGGVVERLNTILDRVLAAVMPSAGGAWEVQAPAHEPASGAPATVLLNRLSTMRYHRADAHAAAWHAAGWTTEQIQAMPWGSEWSDERRAIEHDTNVRASEPYAVLTADERLQLLADLAALM
jgi:hypothetical protein